MATTKQELAIARMAENGGNASKAMREVGYSKVTAASPSKLTKSKGFEALVQKYLPDTHLMQKHREMLDSKRTVRTIMKGAVIEEKEETDPVAILVSFSFLCQGDETK